MWSQIFFLIVSDFCFPIYNFFLVYMFEHNLQFTNKVKEFNFHSHCPILCIEYLEL